MTDHIASADAQALADLRRRAAEPDELRGALAQRVGVPVDASPAVLLAALDEALAERAEDVPDGTVSVDEDALADLRRDAEVGRNLRRDELINGAVRDGRIPPAARASWITLLNTDSHSAEAMLKSLRPNVIPVKLLGRSGDQDEAAELGRDLGFGWQ